MRECKYCFYSKGRHCGSPKAYSLSISFWFHLSRSFEISMLELAPMKICLPFEISVYWKKHSWKMHSCSVCKAIFMNFFNYSNISGVNLYSLNGISPTAFIWKDASFGILAFAFPSTALPHARILSLLAHVPRHYSFGHECIEIVFVAVLLFLWPIERQNSEKSHTILRIL